MNPTHHPGEEMLVDYAAGSLSEPAAMVVATHLALCPPCRACVKELEAVGGALLEAAEPAPMSHDILETLLARLDEPAPAGSPSAPPVRTAPCACRILPQPLRSYVGLPLAEIPWRTVTRGVREVEIKIGHGPARSRLFRIAAGATVPRHTHEGIELTMVLAGGFTDQRGRFRRGDVALSDRQIDHSPRADLDEDCLCVAVTDGPLKLTGRLSRLFNRFVRI